MIKCLMDVTVPEDSECYYCCYYCNEKDICNYSCPMAKQSDENEIMNNCINAFDE